LKYETKSGKQSHSFVDHVPPRNVKSSIALVVRLLLEHSKVPEDKIVIEASAMKIIKNISKDDVFQSNSLGMVNTTFARFVIDFLSMLLL
jgi:hypothetical protein